MLRLNGNIRYLKCFSYTHLFKKRQYWSTESQKIQYYIADITSNVGDVPGGFLHLERAKCMRVAVQTVGACCLIVQFGHRNGPMMSQLHQTWCRAIHCSGIGTICEIVRTRNYLAHVKCIRHKVFDSYKICSSSAFSLFCFTSMVLCTKHRTSLTFKYRKKMSNIIRICRGMCYFKFTQTIILAHHLVEKYSFFNIWTTTLHVIPYPGTGYIMRNCVCKDIIYVTICARCPFF